MIQHYSEDSVWPTVIVPLQSNFDTGGLEVNSPVNLTSLIHLDCLVQCHIRAVPILEGGAGADFHRDSSLYFPRDK